MMKVQDLTLWRFNIAVELLFAARHPGLLCIGTNDPMRSDQSFAGILFKAILAHPGLLLLALLMLEGLILNPGRSEGK